MAKFIRKTRTLKYGLAQLGRTGNGEPSSVARQVHDGDTLNVFTASNFGIRFLGIDTPEKTFPILGSGFKRIDYVDWQQFLNDPFLDSPDSFIEAMPLSLLENLSERVGQGCAVNHYYHADRASKYLRSLIKFDMEVQGKNAADFEFFLAFAREVMDSFGRLLCYVNRSQRDGSRPPTYNIRMLQAGYASPYFIWLNVLPFAKPESVTNAVPRPDQIVDLNELNKLLSDVRQAVKDARRQSLGIFEENNPLRLEAFELRFLARQRPPNRWLLDLSGENSGLLLHPTSYPRIPFAEDRLWIPAEYCPLFESRGWTLEEPDLE